MIMRCGAALAILFIYTTSDNARAEEDADNSCEAVECSAGSIVISHFTKEEIYYECPVKEYSEYVNYVFSLVSLIHGMTGKLPNISPITGEPEQTGESKAVLDTLRNEAKVSTLDQAFSACKLGKNRQTLMVLNYPADGTSMWVAKIKSKENFWMPKSSLTMAPSK